MVKTIYLGLIMAGVAMFTRVITASGLLDTQRQVDELKDYFLLSVANMEHDIIKVSLSFSLLELLQQG